MGTMTDLAIKTWQQKAGLRLPSPAAREAWRELQQAAFEMIKIAELEISGIRDGDSGWHGSDVIGHTLTNLQRRINCAENAYEMERHAEKRIERLNAEASASLSEPLPWDDEQQSY